jgi:hypothetical protein
LTLTDPRPWQDSGRGFFVKGTTLMYEQAHKILASRPLAKLAPGLYADDLGLRYFYLTGMYVSVNSSLLRASVPGSPGLVTDILEELRQDFTSVSCIELMD